MSDNLHRFLLEELHVRGEWVKLDTAWQQITNTTAYPKAVQRLLGEATVAITLLSASLKFKGSLTLQVNDTHPVNMLVVQATSDGSIRAMAQWDESVDIDDDASYSDLLKGTHSNSQNKTRNKTQENAPGTLVITVEQDANDNQTERYQSIIALEGDSLADTLAAYFQQSEQLPTYFQLSTGDSSVAGFMLQTLPAEDDAEGWNHALTLAQTLTDTELLELGVEDILHRLYHQEDRSLYEAEPVHFACSCSQQKIEDTIYSLGEAEAASVLQEQGKISISCQFCNQLYELDSIDITRIFSGLSNAGLGSVH